MLLFDSWVRSHLPKLNGAIDSATHQSQKEELLTTLVRDGLGYQSAAMNRTSALDDRERALVQIGALGTFLSSAVKHGLSAEDPRFSAVRDQLRYLAQFARHPAPRDSYYTYFTDNYPIDGCRYTFTGELEEVAFIEVAQRSLRQYDEALEAISVFHRALVENNVHALEDGDLISILRNAANHVEKARSEFLSMMSGSIDQRVTPAFFFDKLRDYYVTYEIDGESWPAPSIALAPSVMAIDLRLGLADDEQRTYIAKSRRLMMVRERLNVDAALATDSIPELVDLDRCGKSERQYPALKALHDLYLALGQASATHWALVVNYIIKPARKDPRPRVVDPHRGVSGMQLGDVKEISIRRRTHPFVARLKDRVGKRGGVC